MNRLLGVGILLMCLAGCGHGYPETAVVTGKVTYKGLDWPCAPPARHYNPHTLHF